MNKLLSNRDFRRLLRIERMRTDRGGSAFCLVTFHWPQHADHYGVQLAKQIELRLRATDCSGVTGANEIGVILWQTSFDRAKVFVNRVCSDMCGLDELQIVVRVYPYHLDREAEDSCTQSEAQTCKVTGQASVSRVSAAGSLSAANGQVAAPHATGQATLFGPSEFGCEEEDATTPPANGSDASSQVAAQLVDTLDVLESTIATELNDTGAVVEGPESLNVFFSRPLPVWKRTLDVIGSFCGLVVISPVLLAAALLVRLTSPGPVIFRQLRAGKDGKPFVMYKFRSMVADAEQRKKALMERNERDGPAFKIEKDPRITRVGRFIRATSIDELPQLWNVLKGDMSLVGPRPLPLHESDACEDWQKNRLDVTPGLTCIWQTQENRSAIPFVDWVRMDLRYARSRSLKEDITLIWRTIVTMVARRGT